MQPSTLNHPSHFASFFSRRKVTDSHFVKVHSFNHLLHKFKMHLRTLTLHPNVKSPSITRPWIGQLNEVLIDHFNKFKMGAGSHICIPCLLAGYIAVAMLSQAAQAQAAPRQVQRLDENGREREREREYCANACVAVAKSGSARGGRSGA